MSAVRAHTPDAAFALRRAEAEAKEAGSPVGGALRRVLRRLRDERVEPLWTESLSGALVRAGGALERAREFEGARALFELGAELRGSCATTTLHAARAARLAGDRDGALAHYQRAQTLDDEGRIARLARIGEAMLSESGERRISEEIRQAVRAGDRVAAGVGLEARATVRCETARCHEAIRDLCVCALRYPDREDQARAAERVAELLIHADDLNAAREALLLVHQIGTPAQRAAARERLRAISAALGDVLGGRRWGGGETGVVEATPTLARTWDAEPASARRIPLPMIRNWRDAVERTAGAG